MSDYWTESVYAEVEREAHSDWLRNRPPPDRPSLADTLCDGCGQPVCDEDCR